MKQYSAKDIRNIAIVGHGGSGKTTFVESLLYTAGATDRFGKTASGNTVTDFDAEEIKRGSSLNMAIAPVEYKNTKLNLLDAPGLFDFVLGQHEAIRAADTVVVALSGKSGMAVGAKKAFKEAAVNKKPRALFIGKLYSESADYYKVLNQFKDAFGSGFCPIVVPYVEEHKVVCYIDLVANKAYAYKDGKASEVAMPDFDMLDDLKDAMNEAIAETDEELMDKYFEGEEFTAEEMLKGLKTGIATGTLYPVFGGSAQEQEAIDLFLNYAVDLLPSAADVAGETAVNEAGDAVEVACDANGDAAAYVFKTLADPFVGKMSYVKVVSGKIAGDTELVNMTSGNPEKIGKLLHIFGKKQEEIKVIEAGDICAISKLNANTGETLCSPKNKVVFKKADFPAPCYSMAIVLTGKGDESKISQGIARLLEEDPTLAYEINKETHEQVLSGLGEQHLDVTIAKLKSKFGVDVSLAVPTVAYRETIRKSSQVQGKHKKQSGGHGQYGDVIIRFEPCDSDGLVFAEEVVGGSVPRNFFPAVEKGLQDCVQHGVLAGYPVVGLKATLVDGSYHDVDSSEMSFKMAASLAYKAGLPQASPVILEPIGDLKVLVPNDVAGDMMGELNKRRGRVMGMNAAEDGMTEIVAEAPMSEMQDFTMSVRQMTQGAGSFVLTFARYDQLPSNLEAAVIANSKNKDEE